MLNYQTAQEFDHAIPEFAHIVELRVARSSKPQPREPHYTSSI